MCSLRAVLFLLNQYTLMARDWGVSPTRTLIDDFSAHINRWIASIVLEDEYWPKRCPRRALRHATDGDALATERRTHALAFISRLRARIADDDRIGSDDAATLLLAIHQLIDSVQSEYARAPSPPVRCNDVTTRFAV